MSKKDIVKYIIDEYGVTSPTDITNALKDLLGETLQDMLNSEFDEHMGYDKYDQKTDKTNYRNGTSKKTVKTSQGNIDLDIPRDRNSSFDPAIIENTIVILVMLITKLSTYMPVVCLQEISVILLKIFTV